MYRSAHPYLDRDDPVAGPKHIERTHPLVRVHPATGWKALWVNRAMTERIVELDKAESDLVLGYLFDVFEKDIDIQVRFRWNPCTSALWDNRYDNISEDVHDAPVAKADDLLRITIHNASWDYEGTQLRRGTRVTALAEVPFFREDAPTRRQALGLTTED